MLDRKKRMSYVLFMGMKLQNSTGETRANNDRPGKVDVNATA